MSQEVKVTVAATTSTADCGFGAVDVNINVNGKPSQTIRAQLNAGAPPLPAGGMPIAVPF
jgi:hypothetical protein